MLGFFKKLFYKILFAFSGKKKRLYYLNSKNVLPEPLTIDREIALIAELEAGSSEARQTLIEHNLRLVIYIAKKFENTGVSIEDLISIGTIGLIKAINSFKGDKNIKIATYASRCIENEILMHLRKVVKYKTEISLDEPLNVDFEGNELLLSDILGTDGNIVSRDLEEAVELKLLRKSLEHLNGREKQIIEMRFGLNNKEEKTQKEVADLMGISQSYISRLEKKIVCRLKKEMDKFNC